MLSGSGADTEPIEDWCLSATARSPKEAWAVSAAVSSSGKGWLFSAAVRSCVEGLSSEPESEPERSSEPDWSSGFSASTYKIYLAVVTIWRIAVAIPVLPASTPERESSVEKLSCSFSEPVISDFLS